MRCFYIDVLRFIGLAMIVLAHVNPPDIIFQIRNFDVPLMVVVAGMSFFLSYQKSSSYSDYLVKRVARLVLPVWLFLCGYFLSLWLLMPSSEELNLRTIATSFLLIDGIGYVWIIKVFLLVALVAPIMYEFSIKTVSDQRFFLVVGLGMLGYEVVRFISMPFMDNALVAIVSQVTHYLVPYSLLFAVGLRLGVLSRPSKLYLLMASGGVCLLFAILLYLRKGEWISTQEMKYPPSLYYTSYALFITMILFVVKDKLQTVVVLLKLDRFVSFCAKNSIWIYLWHIPMIKFYQDEFLAKYILVFSCSILLAYCQVSLVNLAVSQMQSESARRRLKSLLTG